MAVFAFRNSRVKGDWTLECPKKFALGDVLVEGMGLRMPFGDGLKDAIWKCDRVLSGDGLRDAIWKWA